MAWTTPTPRALARRLQQLVRAGDVESRAHSAAADMAGRSWEATADEVCAIVERETWTPMTAAPFSRTPSGQCGGFVRRCASVTRKRGSFPNRRLERPDRITSSQGLLAQPSEGAGPTRTMD